MNLHSIFAKPIHAPRKRPALAHHQCANAKLPHQAAAIPAGSKCRHHHHVAIARLSAGAPEGIRLCMNTRIVLLHAPVVPTADQFSRFP